jgi:hypothetical protein
MDHNEFITQKCIRLAKRVKPLILFGGQKELAKKLKCSNSALSLALSGKRKNDSSSVLMERALEELEKEADNKK